MKPRAALRVVGAEPAPDLSYEARERRYVLSRDWAAVHVAGDRREPVNIPERVRRWWR